MSEVMIPISIEAQIPEELLQKFFQHLRDFDVAHRDRCEFNVLADTEQMTRAKVEAILGSIVPGFTNKVVITREEPKT